MKGDAGVVFDDVGGWTMCMRTRSVRVLMNLDIKCLIDDNATYLGKVSMEVWRYQGTHPYWVPCSEASSLLSYLGTM